MDKKNARSLAIQRAVLTVLCVVLGIVLAVMIGATAVTGHLLNRLNYAEAEQAAPALSEEEVAAMEQTVPSLPGFTVPEITPAEVDFGTGPQLETGGGKIVNILLVGQDSAAETGARSDTIILCTFNKEKNTITMTSFLRDLYVKIPGCGKDRINAAFSIGGTELLNKTLKENFGVEVDGNVRVDFARFQEIIDLLGGVTLDLTEAEAGFINKHVRDSAVTAGENLLSGKQALMYARNRHDVDGDFSRTNRQRKLLSALIEAYKSKRLTEMLSLVNDILPMITTDISKTDLTAYAVTLFPMLSTAEIKTQHIPVSGGYYHANIDEKSVLVPYLDKNRQVLNETLS